MFCTMGDCPVMRIVYTYTINLGRTGCPTITLSSSVKSCNIFLLMLIVSILRDFTIFLASKYFSNAIYRQNIVQIICLTSFKNNIRFWSINIKIISDFRFYCVCYNIINFWRSITSFGFLISVLDFLKFQDSEVRD